MPPRKSTRKSTRKSKIPGKGDKHTFHIMRGSKKPAIKVKAKIEGVKTFAHSRGSTRMAWAKNPRSDVGGDKLWTAIPKK